MLRMATKESVRNEGRERELLSRGSKHTFNTQFQRRSVQISIEIQSPKRRVGIETFAMLNEHQDQGLLPGAPQTYVLYLLI